MVIAGQKKTWAQLCNPTRNASGNRTDLETRLEHWGAPERGPGINPPAAPPGNDPINLHGSIHHARNQTCLSNPYQNLMKSRNPCANTTRSRPFPGIRDPERGRRRNHRRRADNHLRYRIIGTMDLLSMNESDYENLSFRAATTHILSSIQP